MSHRSGITQNDRATDFRDRQIRLMHMFRSARVKLTLFYLAILLCFSLTLTVGVRLLAEHEINRSNIAERGEIQALTRNGLRWFIPHPETDFISVQRSQSDIVRQNLNRDLILLNAIALVAGGAISYWYAGRALKPIADAHEAQARFVGDASHELRTPLANIRAENEVFLRQKSFDETEARELITSNLEEVQRLENLSSSLLALAYYGNSSLTLDSVSVQSVIDSALIQAERTLRLAKSEG